ncbi:phospholipase-like protein [Tanacetum coccineum]
MPPISSFYAGVSSSQEYTHQLMSPISSFPMVEESADEHEIGRQVECLDGETEIVPLSCHLGHDIQIQFGREEFCLLTGLRFGVDYSDVYEEGLISFRRRVFDSAKDGKPITGEILEAKINGKDFKVSNDRDDWDMYPWGSYVWPTLYYQLRNANVKRWQPLYATEQEEGDDDHNSYLLMGFTWSFKGRRPTPTLTPDDYEARSDWGFHREVQHSRRRQSPLSLKAPKQRLLMIIIRLPGIRIRIRLLRTGKPYATTRKCPVVFPLWREARPNMYVQSPYIVLPPTTVLPKKWVDKSRNKGRNANVAPSNLENAFVNDNEVDAEVLITGVRDTDDYIVYEKVDLSKVRREHYTECMQFLYHPEPVYLDFHIMGYSVPKLFWRELVPNLYMGSYHAVEDPNTEGWLSEDTDPHIIGTLDGLMRLYHSWDEVDWVYMPINAGGDHWVTGAINLPNSRFYVFDSLHSEVRMSTLYDHIRNWTNVVNVILENRGHFQRTRRQPYNFQFIYNDGLNCPVLQQENLKDCGVVTCWLTSKLFVGEDPRVYGERKEFWNNVRYQMLHMFYNCRCGDTRNCGYD